MAKKTLKAGKKLNPTKTLKGDIVIVKGTDVPSTSL